MSKTLSLYLKMFKSIGPFKGAMALAILAGTVGFMAAFSLMVLAASLLLEALAPSLPLLFDGASLPRLPVVLGTVLLCLAAFFRAVLHYIEQLFNHYIAFKVLAHLRDLLFKAMRKLCPAKLERQARGSLISIISGDIELLEVFYAHTVSPIAIALSVFVLLELFFLQIHPLFALASAIIYLVVGIVLPIGSAKRSEADAMRQRKELASLNSQFLDSLEGSREIVQYQAEKDTLKRLGDLQARMTQNQRALNAELSKQEGRIDLLVLASIVGMTLFAIHLAQSAAIAPASALLASFCFLSSFGPFVALARLGPGLVHTTACGHRVIGLLEEAPEVAPVLEGPRPAFEGLEAKALNFSYGTNEPPLLKDLDFVLEKGSIVGIKGPSGCGKSTFLKLVMRFWDPTSGKLLFSKAPLASLPTEHLRRGLSLVTQETALFTGSLAENLRIAKADASDAELWEALDKASLKHYVEELKDGLDSKVSELGDNFSGGERQRLALARAFLANTPLLLLDEPSSQLDALNEAIILKALAEHRGNRTVLMVSHRPSTLSLCDKVYAMDAGKLHLV